MTPRTPDRRPEPAYEQQLVFKRGNESVLTYRLKWAAWEWLYRKVECSAIGFEVRLEGPFGRIADVVGVGPGNIVYLIEVKASRSDKARDDNSRADLEKLKKSGPTVEETVKLTAGILEASAARARDDGGEPWHRDPTYRQALADHARASGKERRLRERIATFSTKFHDPSYLHVAHCHYVMAPAGLIRLSEVPPMWGLLNDTPAVRVEAPEKQVPDATAHVMRAIARANTRDVMSAYGVERNGSGARGARFPEWT